MITAYADNHRVDGDGGAEKEKERLKGEEW
jgi:hypothetical protein